MTSRLLESVKADAILPDTVIVGVVDGYEERIKSLLKVPNQERIKIVMNVMNNI